MKSIINTGVMLFVVLGLAACSESGSSGAKETEEKGVMAEMQDGMGKAAEATKDSAMDMKESAESAAAAAADKAGEMMDDAEEAVEEAADDAADMVEDAKDKAADMMK